MRRVVAGRQLPARGLRARRSCSTASSMPRARSTARPTLARPGTRDPYSGCVGAYLERNDLYDFMLFSLPDNDHYSHRHGPGATRSPRSRAPTRTSPSSSRPAGGVEPFFSDHAVILMADHSQIGGRRPDPARHGARRTGGSCSRTIVDPAEAELAVCPGARSAMVYVLARGRSAGRHASRCSTGCATLEGVEVLAWRDGEEACVWTERGELRFRPGVGERDAYGRAWDVEGVARGAGARARRRRARQPRLSGRAPAAVVRARLRRRRRRPGVGCARLRVRRLGRRRSRRRRQPRLAAPRRLARARSRSSTAAPTSTAARSATGRGRSRTCTRSSSTTSASSAVRTQATGTVRRHVVVRGRVQGVFFRDTVRSRGRAGGRRRLGAQQPRRHRRGRVRGRRRRGRARSLRWRAKGPPGARVEESRSSTSPSRESRASVSDERVGYLEPRWMTLTSP